jgi:hypothetical protein
MYYKNELNSYIDNEVYENIEMTPAVKLLYIFLDNMKDDNGEIITTYQELATLMNLTLHKLYPILKMTLHYLCLDQLKYKIDGVNYLFFYFDPPYWTDNRDPNKIFIKKLNARLNNEI